MRRNVPPLAWVSLAVLLASAAALVAVVSAPQEAKAAFPGKNGRIAFYKASDGGNSDIYAVFPDGSGMKRITYSGVSEVWPAWSPDGSRVAFVRYAPNMVAEIFVKNIQNGQLTRLTENSVYDSDPAWSPNGSKIVFTSDRNGTNDDIWVMNSDGTDPRRLTTDPGNENEPAWSPDGTKIAFVKDDADIWAMNSDGQQAALLYDSERVCCQDGTPEKPVFPGNPAWSPDGSRIAFDGAYYVTALGGYSVDVYAMDTNGAGLVNLTNTPQLVEAHPAWSPNGKKIAFASSSPTTNNDIFKMDADGSDRKNVTNTPSEVEWTPDWQPLPVP
jgi:Tol biopolymer transport system component